MLVKYQAFSASKELKHLWQIKRLSKLPKYELQYILTKNGI